MFDPPSIKHVPFAVEVFVRVGLEGAAFYEELARIVCNKVLLGRLRNGTVLERIGHVISVCLSVAISRRVMSYSRGRLTTSQAPTSDASDVTPPTETTWGIFLHGL